MNHQLLAGFPLIYQANPAKSSISSHLVKRAYRYWLGNHLLLRGHLQVAWPKGADPLEFEHGEPPWLETSEIASETSLFWGERLPTTIQKNPPYFTKLLSYLLTKTIQRRSEKNNRRDVAEEFQHWIRWHLMCQMSWVERMASNFRTQMWKLSSSYLSQFSTENSMETPWTWEVLEFHVVGKLNSLLLGSAIFVENMWNPEYGYN